MLGSTRESAGRSGRPRQYAKYCIWALVERVYAAERWHDGAIKSLPFFVFSRVLFSSYGFNIEEVGMVDGRALASKLANGESSAARFGSTD